MHFTRIQLGALLLVPALAWAEGPPAPPTDAPKPQKPARKKAAPRPAPPSIRGMGLTLHSKDPKYDYGPMLAELPKLGVNFVTLLLHVYQPNGGSAAPARHPLKTPSDRTILKVIRQARKLNMEVGLLPIVLLEKPGGDDWRGNLKPPDARGRTKDQEGYTTPAWGRWFKGYGRVIEHYARLAQEGGASLFSVGSELSSTEGQTDRWRRLIKRVRKLFAGELTYSANWDHYEHVGFWQDLDYLGLSGYYELTESKAPRQQELDAAWVKVRDKLVRWRAKNRLTRKQFLFLEVGYASIDGCASKPWDYTMKTRVDLLEQRDCYRAFVHAWNGRRELAGVFFYEWWGYGGKQDRSYTPRGKPALEVLQRWFKQTKKR